MGYGYISLRVNCEYFSVSFHLLSFKSEYSVSDLFSPAFSVPSSLKVRSVLKTALTGINSRHFPDGFFFFTVNVFPLTPF